MTPGARLAVSNVRMLRRGRKEQATATLFCPKDRARRPVAGCYGCPHRGDVRVEGKDHWVQCLMALPPPSPRSPSDAPVSDYMTHNVVCVTPDLSVAELVLLLVEKRLTGAPVVNDQGMVIGVVSQSDLVRESYDEAEAWVDAEHSPSDRLKGPAFEPPIGSTVAGVMTAAPRVLRESATLRQAGQVMAQERVHRLPIVDEQGVVVGILSTLDLARFVANSD